MSKGWAYNASEGMADGLSADACWVVFPMEEGAVVAGLFFGFGFCGGVQFSSIFVKDEGQCFWAVSSIEEEVGEKS